MPIQVYNATITKITVLTPTVRGIDVRLEHPEAFVYKTGQWVNMHLNHNGTMIKRAFSIASPEHINDPLHFCVKRVEHGIGSSILFSFEEGDTFSISGPFGHFTLRPSTNEINLVATGSGVAPLRAMILDLLHKNVKGPIRLFFGNRTEDEIIYRTEFEQLAAAHANFTFHPVLSFPGPEWKGAKGHVQDVLERLDKSKKNQDFYICGLKDMVLSMKQQLEETGFAKERIFFERYD